MRLGKVAEYVRGVAYKTGEDLSAELGKGYVTLLRANNIQNGKLVLDDVQYVDRAKVKPRQLLKKGDILICASSGSKRLVGKAAFVPEDMDVTFGAFCCVMRPCGINAEYLSYYFQSNAYRKAIEETSTGSNINNLKANDLTNLSIKGYGSNTGWICSLFHSACELLDSANRQLALLDDLVKSRFIEMLGDPCDPGSSSAKSRIDSFCELRIGPFGSALHKEDYITGGHPLVNPSHIIGGAIRPDENLTIDDGKYESLAAYHLLPGDVVLGRRGEIGRCAVVKTDGLICGTAA